MNCSVSPSMSRHCRMSVAISRMCVSVSSALCSWLHFRVLAVSCELCSILCFRALAAFRWRLLAAVSGVCSWLRVRALTASSRRFFAAFSGVLTVYSRRLFAALSGVSLCLCFRLLAESRSRLLAASSGVLEPPTLSHVGCELNACFGCLLRCLHLFCCLVASVGLCDITLNEFGPRPQLSGMFAKFVQRDKIDDLLTLHMKQGKYVNDYNNHIHCICRVTYIQRPLCLE